MRGIAPASASSVPDPLEQLEEPVGTDVPHAGLHQLAEPSERRKPPATLATALALSYVVFNRRLLAWLWARTYRREHGREITTTDFFMIMTTLRRHFPAAALYENVAATVTVLSNQQPRALRDDDQIVLAFQRLAQERRLILETSR